ncbi:MAG: hypothetical protein QM709_05905 [Spongiibacteraceae bacterium]
MCLLESVTAYDETSIVCTARDHRDNTHPLRHDGKLPITAGIEYAAQAMALHAILTRQNSAVSNTTAMLVQLSDVHWNCDTLDQHIAPLVIRAEQTNALGNSASYHFQVLEKAVVLIEGQMLVHFQTDTGNIGSAD